MKQTKIIFFLLACDFAISFAHQAIVPTALADEQAELRFGSSTCGPCNWEMTDVDCPKSADAQGDCNGEYAPGCGGTSETQECTDYQGCYGVTNCDTATAYDCEEKS